MAWTVHTEAKQKSQYQFLHALNNYVNHSEPNVTLGVVTFLTMLPHGEIKNVSLTTEVKIPHFTVTERNHFLSNWQNAEFWEVKREVCYTAWTEKVLILRINVHAPFLHVRLADNRIQETTLLQLNGHINLVYGSLFEPYSESHTLRYVSTSMRDYIAVNIHPLKHIFCKLFLDVLKSSSFSKLQTVWIMKKEEKKSCEFTSSRITVTISVTKCS